MENEKNKKIYKVDKVIEDLDYKIWVLLRQTRDVMIKDREKELQKTGISGIQSAVLIAVIEAGKNSATPAQISKWLIREPHTISALLKRMDKQGLIKCTKDLPRHNMIRVRVTDKGREAYKIAKKREGLHRIVNTLSTKQRMTLLKLLRKLKESALDYTGIKYDLYPHI